MQTTLPDLPLTNYGQAILNPTFHSSTKTAPRKHPRTDLANLNIWTSFPIQNDIHQVIQSATNCANLPPTPFTVGVSSKTRLVKSEE
ncbi:hypothetical protein BYT27DRAFT_7121811 [Phlegmacium glaucopus]|nr:hypothetical protein BYT27DRAFT_7121811 [Phlegmacium glaucopus]